MNGRVFKGIIIVFLSLNLYCGQKISIPLKEYEKRVNSQQNRFENISVLWDSPYNLNGKNVKVAIFDGGKIYDKHIEFKDRKIIQKSDIKTDQHSTSIASIIIAKGENRFVKGIANKATLYNFLYKRYKYSSAIKEALKYKIFISNHSYSDIDQKDRFYTKENQKIDSIVYKNPSVIALFAAGKSKDFKQLQTIPSLASSKNTLCIGALDEKQKKLIKISPKGPTYDFRIKPDFVYRGLYVLTPTIDDKKGYGIYRGTSISTAFATGIVTLVSEAYKKRFSKDIRFDTLKTILIITADDLVFKGVDNFSGYGRLNAKRAVDFIFDRDFYKKNLFSSIKQNQTKSYNFKLKRDKKVKIAVCWIDPPALEKSKKSLVNDIDIFLTSTDDKRYYPYSINPKNLSITKMQNHFDNCEVIEEKLKKGSYSLKIKGFKIKNIQNFNISSNIAIF